MSRGYQRTDYYELPEKENLSGSRMTQNDEAEKKIFGRLPLIQEIERQGFVYVSAD